MAHGVRARVVVSNSAESRRAAQYGLATVHQRDDNFISGSRHMSRTLAVPRSTPWSLIPGGHAQSHHLPRQLRVQSGSESVE